MPSGCCFYKRALWSGLDCTLSIELIYLLRDWSQTLCNFMRPRCAGTFLHIMSLCVEWRGRATASAVYFGNMQICFLLWYSWAIAGHPLIPDFPFFSNSQLFLALNSCAFHRVTFTLLLAVGVGPSRRECCVINLIFSYPRHFCVLEKGLCDLSLYRNNSVRALRLINR